MVNGNSCTPLKLKELIRPMPTGLLRSAWLSLILSMPDCKEVTLPPPSILMIAPLCRPYMYNCTCTHHHQHLLANVADNTLWNRILKELCKYHANISLDQGLKVLVPPPQNMWLLGNQSYVCWNDLDEEVLSCVFFCQWLVDMSNDKTLLFVVSSGHNVMISHWDVNLLIGWR